MQHIGRRGLSRYFKSFRVWIAFGLILLGGLGLLGWISGLRILGSISSQFIPIAPDTAVFFILFGIILFVDILRPAHRPLKLTSLCFLMLISLYGSLKFIQYFAGLDLTLENILFPAIQKQGSFVLWRMSPITGILYNLSERSS